MAFYKSQRVDSSINEIRLLATDWSGVISDDRQPAYEANMKVFEAHGLPRTTFEEWLSRTAPTVVEFFADNGLEGDPSTLFKEYSDAYGEFRSAGINPIAYPDAQRTLESIFNCGVQIVVISSHPEEHLLKEAAEYGIADYVSAFVGNVKDKAGAMLNVCSETCVEPGFTVYLGDTAYDIKAAKKADVHSVGIATGYHTWERLISEDPDLCFNSLSGFRRAMSMLLRH
jgi:phosphoglycolate phosphatase-like HAD superfamily hydrolase